MVVELQGRPIFRGREERARCEVNADAYDALGAGTRGGEHPLDCRASALDPVTCVLRDVLGAQRRAAAWERSSDDPMIKGSHCAAHLRALEAHQHCPHALGPKVQAKRHGRWGESGAAAGQTAAQGRRGGAFAGPKQQAGSHRSGQRASCDRTLPTVPFLMLVPRYSLYFCSLRSKEGFS